MFSILVIITSSFILWLAVWFYRVKHYETYLKKIPGPTPLPLVGNGLDFLSATTVSIIPKLTEYRNKYGNNFKIYIGSQPYIYLTEPRDVEFLLNSTTLLKRSDVYRFLLDWLGTGLLTSHGDKWRKHRKIITPTFHFKILEEFIDIINPACDIFLSKLHNEVGKSSFDVTPIVSRYTLDVICETAMGTCVNAQNDLESKYYKCVRDLTEMVMARGFSFVLSNDILYRFTKMYRREKYALSVVHDFTKNVLKKRKSQFYANVQNSQEEVDSLGRKKKRVFLDLLLEYTSKGDNYLTDTELCEELDTFMFEGFDTTATTLSFLLFALAKNPDVQQKVYEEMKIIFIDDPKRDPTFQDVQQMKYSEMVIKESLRLYSTVPLLGREIDRDTNWNGMMVPKGVMVHVFITGVLLSDAYENPEKFDPERFSPENSRTRDPYSYIPFSAGPRNCIGQKFAMLVLKTTLSKVIRNYEILPVVPEHKPIYKSEGVLRSDNGLLIQLRNRL